MQTQCLQMVKKICCSMRAKKTKPIQTQFKPKQSQFKPIQTQTNPIKANFKPVNYPVLCGNNDTSHLLIATILTLYKTANDRYYTQSKCRCSSMEEHSFRKAEVEGSTPSIGFVKLKSVICLKSSE